MCGIAGWISWDRNIEDYKGILQDMMDTLAKRGPDASGMWISQTAGIVHRRLSVVDLINGAQPMIRKKGESEFIITYNGELYNTPELQLELESLGYSFTTHCDTEVLLISYIEWGDRCVEKFNGIYAFGIWDVDRQNLFLARDRFGVKPLFYTQIGDSLIFGSELKTLLANPFVPHEIDSEGLTEIFALGPSRTPGHGVYRNIKELKPGYCANYNRDGLSVKQYWTLESKPHEDDLDTTVEKVRWLIQDSIKRQLVSDVPLCTFLSGGVDSSAISAVAAKNYKESGNVLHTYSIDYTENEKYFVPSEFQPNSDSYWINMMTDYYKTTHHNIILDNNELAEALIPAAISRDLPGMADVDSSLYLFCREIKKDFTVALSGECADEIFGGYPWYHSPEANLDTFPWIRSLDERVNIISEEVRNKINLKEYVAQRYSDTIAESPKLIGEDPAEAKRRSLFYLNFMWFMATLLDRKDRMSMAWGLEVRVPFCDHRIVEYVWNIPWEMKALNGREKGLMREALKGLLPEPILGRKKSPYPKTHNPQYTAVVKNKLSQIIDDSASPLLQLINLDVVKEILSTDGKSFIKPWFGQLMTGPQLMAYLIQVDTWLKENNVEII